MITHFSRTRQISAEPEDGDGDRWYPPRLSSSQWSVDDVKPVTWTARCPSCGKAAKWHAQAFSTSGGWRRVQYSIECPTEECATAVARDTTPADRARYRA